MLDLILERRGLAWAAALLVCALVLGGGGPHGPFVVGLVEGFGALTLAWFAIAADHRPVGRGAAGGLVFILLTLLVGLAQLVPLPHSTWTSLPGRGLVEQSLALIGRPDESWPISFDPQATRDALLAFLPAVAMFVAVIHLGWRDRRALLVTLIGVGLVSAALGMLQVASGGSPTFNPYHLPPYGLAVGFFANRNHQGLFMASCSILAAGFWLEATRRGAPARLRSLWFSAILLLFPVAALASASRSGVALLAMASILAALMWQLRDASREGGISVRLKRLSHRRNLLVGAGVGIAAFALLLFLLLNSYQFNRITNRYSEVSQDLRFTFWPDVIYVLKLYFPVGTGFATFSSVFQSAETLNKLSFVIINHAHDDYMEIIIECGAAGIAILVAFFAWFGARLVGMFKRSIEHPGGAIMRGAAAVILFVLLHSIVDYPMRTEAIACLFAMCCGLLVQPAPGYDEALADGQGRRRRRSSRRESSRDREARRG